jgi:hypothetical protein
MLEEERGGGGGGGDGAGMSEEKPKVKKEKKRKKRRRSSSSGNGDDYFYCSKGLRKFQHAALEYRYTPVECLHKYYIQCWGSGSGSTGSACFWAFRIPDLLVKRSGFGSFPFLIKCAERTEIMLV